jgi:hypothetical protein
MAKNRQIETDLFSQGWFYELSNEAKVLYVYCYLNSDNSGIIELIKRRIEYDLQIDLEKVFFEIQSEFTALDNGRFLIKRVIRTQCPNGLAHDGRFQSSIIKLLENEGIDTETYEPSKALPKPLESLTKALPKAHSHSNSLSNSSSQSISNSNSSSIGEKIEKKSKRTKPKMTDDEYGRMKIANGFQCYGEFENVFLTDKEMNRAKEKVGTMLLKEAINQLSAWKEDSGLPLCEHVSDIAKMHKWVFDKARQVLDRQGVDYKGAHARELGFNKPKEINGTT